MGTARASGWLVLTLALLAAVAAAELHYGVGRGPGRPPASAAGAPETTTPTPVFALADREIFTETLARPLFMPDRRPAAEETTTAEAPAATTARPEVTRFALSAIVIVDNERTALVTDTATGALRRVREGERLAGWRVDVIRDDSAVLSDGDNQTELSLRVFGPPAPVAAKRDEPPRRRARDAAQGTRPERPRRAPRAAPSAPEGSTN